MVKDGLNPFKKDPASHLVPSDFNIKVVSHFFKETDEKHVAKAFKGIVFYLSTIILFLFLTVQALEKRRWS